MHGETVKFDKKLYIKLHGTSSPVTDLSSSSQDLCVKQCNLQVLNIDLTPQTISSRNLYCSSNA